MPKKSPPSLSDTSKTWEQNLTEIEKEATPGKGFLLFSLCLSSGWQSYYSACPPQWEDQNLQTYSPQITLRLWKMMPMVIKLPCSQEFMDTNIWLMRTTRPTSSSMSIPHSPLNLTSQLQREQSCSTLMIQKSTSAAHKSKWSPWQALMTLITTMLPVIMFEVFSIAMIQSSALLSWAFK